MKRRFHAFYLLAAMVFALSAMPLSALAEGVASRVDCEPVPLDGEWHDYEQEANTYAWCPLQLESDGRLNLSVQTSFETDGSFYITLLDKNCETVCRTSLSSNGAADPTVWKAEYDLTAGLYFVRVESRNNLRGPFRVKAEFTASRGEEQTGDTFETAADLREPRIMGFLSSRQTDAFYPDPLPEDSQNFIDCFKINVEADTFDFSVTPVNPEGKFHCAIYDAGYRQVTYEYNNPAFTIDLADGVYYLCVEAGGHLCGDYVLNIGFKRTEPNANAPENNKDASKDNRVALESGADSRLLNLQIPLGECIPLTNEETESMNLRWGSTNPQVAAVSRDGKIIGVCAGTAYVAAVSEDGTMTLVYQVTVQ